MICVSVRKGRSAACGVYMHKQKFSIVRDVIVVFLLNSVYALGITLFVTPVSLAIGGTTGLALFVQHYTDLSLSVFILIFNIAMFLWGWAMFGRKFALTTVVSTFAYPVSLGVFERLLDGVVLTDNLMLCVIFGGLFIGFGLGMVIRMGASTGGMDIPMLALNKHFRIPVSVSLYVFDVIVLLLQAIFSGAEKTLYGIVMVIIYSVVLDRVLLIGQSRMQFTVITDKSVEVKDSILKEIDRGVTMLHGRTGYLGKETDLVITVVSSREVAKTEKVIRRVDPEAFVMIDRVSEVRGKGFTSEKRYLKSDK